MRNGVYSRGAFQALDIVRHQPGSQQQDKRQDAYDLLALVYKWFTEGVDRNARGITPLLSNMPRAKRSKIVTDGRTASIRTEDIKVRRGGA